MEHYEKLNQGKFIRPLSIPDIIAHPVNLRKE